MDKQKLGVYRLKAQKNTNTLSMTLPAAWCRAQGVSKGVLLEAIITENGLVINNANAKTF